MKPTEVPQFIADLDGGVFEEKLSRAISEAAAAVMDNNPSGKAASTVQVTLTMKQIGSGHQIMIGHKLTTKMPTRNGDTSENNLTATPMHVGPGGRVALFPDWEPMHGEQSDAFDRDGKVKA